MYSFRGVISFVDKARAAQSHGASALIVSNNESSWPYNMTDSNKTGGDIKIPCFMICQKDAELLTITLRKNKENANKSTETSSSSSSNSSSSSSSSSISSSPFSSSSSSASSSSSSSHLAIKLCTRDRKLACPICMSDFELDMEAVKLPCTHFYCHSCIVPWLKKVRKKKKTKKKQTYGFLFSYLFISVFFFFSLSFFFLDFRSVCFSCCVLCCVV